MTRTWHGLSTWRGAWRGGPGQLLALYVTLDAAAAVLVAVSHLPLPQRAQPLAFPVAALFAWRVSRGGRVSRVILLILTTLSFGGAAFMHAPPWSPFVLGLLAVYGTQLVLLVSPAVYQRTSRDAPPAQGGTASARWRPPTWVLPSALLAGLVVTLLSLGSMQFGRAGFSLGNLQQPAAVPGCGPAGATIAELPGRCITLAEGYPVRFLTAYQGEPVINDPGLGEDWAQWSLVSFTVLYLAWLLHLRPGPQPGRSPVAEQPSQA